ncbi:DUF4419 domain-containing protein [Rhizophagus clarus]|nr:DUF4419 domain-containing protein [Rhizophagus clarus]
MKVSIFVNDILHHENSHIKGNLPEAVNRLDVATDEAVEKIDIKSLLECNFFTITNNSRTASCIVLLDTVKAYFCYKMYFACGISKITLEGTLEDWAKIIFLNYFGSGGDFAINEWMTAFFPFFPYRNDGKILENNSIEPNDIPNGRVEVPFTTDTGFSLKFVSGFLGAQQKTLENSNELVVLPVIGWFVIDNKDSEGENEN